MATPQPAQPHEAGLESQREEVLEASMRLPERQREALALRELEQLSYVEIAAAMEVSPSSVAQLISRARINLYDELRGTVLASIAAPSPDCERALPMIAAREDGQLEASTGEADWLDAHLADCDRCRLAVEQMGKAEAFYRSSAPIGAAGGSPSGVSPASLPAPSRAKLPRGRAALAGALALLLLGGLAAAFAGDDGAPAPASPAAGAASGKGVGESEPGTKPVTARGEKKGAVKEKAKASTTAGEANSGGASPVDAAPTPVTIPAQETTGGGDAPSEPISGPTHPSGKTGVGPTKQTSVSKPSPKPKPAATATPASQPASAPEPAPVAEAPPAEEPSDEPGRRGEAPGKPPGRPPH